MTFRAIFWLCVAVSASIAATVYFGEDVLIALGLILTQIKVLSKKIASIEWAVFLTWLKAHTSAFFRFELLKKWFYGTLLPLFMGRTLLRRMARFTQGYIIAVKARFDSMMQWYRQLSGGEKAIATAIILATTVALSVTSIGLWLILFSVKLPLWVAAAVAAGWKMLWASLEKVAFKTVAFFQLGWLWRKVRRLIPAKWLERKRRADFRLARAVVRRRRMTVRQLAQRKDSLPFRIGLLLDFLVRR